MAEARYGRLFTEADVKVLMRCGGWVADGEPDPDLASALEVADAVRPLTFPADEPLFLLRGQDRFAADTASAYVRKLLFWLERGADPPTAEFVGDASEAYQTMRQWQIDHPDRVKVPD